jgi:hypothetical protein
MILDPGLFKRKAKEKELRSRLIKQIIDSSARVNKLKHAQFVFNRGYSKLTLMMSHPVAKIPSELVDMQLNLTEQVNNHVNLIKNAYKELLHLCKLENVIDLNDLGPLSSHELTYGYATIERIAANTEETEVYYLFLNINDLIKETKENSEEVKALVRESYSVIEEDYMNFMYNPTW